MISVEDRIPARAGQFKITDTSTGAVSTVVLTRDDNPSVEGTKVNKLLFDSIQKQTRCVRFTIPPVSWNGTDAPYMYTAEALGVTEEWIPGQPVLISVSDADSRVPATEYAETSVLEYNLAMREALGCLTMIISSDNQLTLVCAEDKPEAFLDIRIPGIVSEKEIDVGEFEED